MTYRKVSEIFDTIEKRKKNIDIISTGYPSIDIALDGGFFKQEMIILGGKPGSGKSFLASSLFYKIAKQGFKSAYFSLEISSDMLVSRLIGADADIQPTTVMLKKTDEQTQEKILDAKANVSVYENLMYFYDDIYDYPTLEKEILANKFDFVVIDFIQNILTTGKDEYERLSKLAHNFQRLAKQANICLLVVSQLSNTISKERRTDIVEYKGSGEIAIVCDFGFHIAKGKNGVGSFVLQMRKARRCITGTEMNFKLVSPGGRILEDEL